MGHLKRLQAINDPTLVHKYYYKRTAKPGNRMPPSFESQNNEWRKLAKYSDECERRINVLNSSS